MIKSKLVKLWIALTVGCVQVPVLAQWVDVVPNPMETTIGKTIGASWGDVDGDGDDDICLGTTSTGPTHLFLNDGNGNFDRQYDSLLDQYYPVWSPTLGDYDNDGDLDVFLISFGQPSRLLKNNGGATFVEVTSDGLFSGDGNLMARGGAWADFDADGLLDIMVSTNAPKPTVQNDKLYQNLGGDMFSDVSPSVFGDMSIGRGVVWSDFDNDGDVDLYAVGGKGCPCDWEAQPEDWLTNAENRMFENVDGVFVDVTTDVTVDIDHGRGVTAGDYDNDGDMDLYICNITVTGEEGSNPESYGGDNKLLRNDGDFVFTDVTPLELVGTGNHRGCGWLDFDNDGDLDLLTIAMNGDITTMFENINAGKNFVPVFEDVFGNPFYQGISGGACSFSDYDIDGDVDVFISHKNGSNRLIRNELANDNDWIEIKLEGIESNRGGIGARIKVTTSQGEQISDVRTGTGYWGQNSLVQHFGLGLNASIQRIDVTWPSGIHQTIVTPSSNERLEVVECEGVCSCEGDINGDGSVDVTDFVHLINEWGDCIDCLSDLNADGVVNVQDILVIVVKWGACP